MATETIIVLSLETVLVETVIAAAKTACAVAVPCLPVIGGIAVGGLLVGAVATAIYNSASGGTKPTGKTEQKTEAKPKGKQVKTTTEKTAGSKILGDKRPPRRRRSSSSFSINTEVDISVHVERRLKQTVFVSGIGHFISEQTFIPRNDVLKVGPATDQDQHSTIESHHAAHVVRVQVGALVNAVSPQYYEPLRTLVGRTDIIERWGNVGSIGRAMDRIQTDYFPRLAEVDFENENLDENARNILENLKQKFLEAIQNHINELNRKRRNTRRDENEEELVEIEQRVNQLREAEKRIKQITPERLFEIGRNGFDSFKDIQ